MNSLLITVDIPEEEFLISLQGKGFGNLTLIETLCDVSMGGRGSSLFIKGDAPCSYRAFFVVSSLYDRFQEHDTQDITKKDIHIVFDHVQALEAENKGDLSFAFSKVVEKEKEVQQGAHHVKKSFDQAENHAIKVVLSDMTHKDHALPMRSITVTKGRTIQSKTKGQAQFLEALDQNSMVFALGPAGTGKTYLAVCYGLSLLLLGKVKRLVLSRPAVAAGESLGYLPGDMKEKIDPYLRPIYDILHEFLPPEQIQNYLKDQTIEIAPLAFMRGRTLQNCFVILDEAQNTTPMQMKMFLTRFGEHGQMVITGDVSQKDVQGLSGLQDAVRRLKGIKGIAMTELTSKDVMRHPLVRDIIKAYDKE